MYFEPLLLSFRTYRVHVCSFAQLCSHDRFKVLSACVAYVSTHPTITWLYILFVCTRGPFLFLFPLPSRVPRLELLSTRKGLNSIPTDIQQHLTESVVNLESPVPPASTLRTKRVSLVAQRLRHIINPKMASLDRGGGGGGGGGRGRGLEGGNGDPDVVNGRSSSHFHYLDRSAYAEKFKSVLYMYKSYIYAFFYACT